MTSGPGIPASATPAWQPLLEQVKAALQALAVDEALVVSEAVTADTPVITTTRRGPLAAIRHSLGLGRERTFPNPRWVQFVNVGKAKIYGECVGATAFGGPAAISPETDVLLRELGWLGPPDPGWSDLSLPRGPGAPMYRTMRDHAEIPALAQLAVDSFATLGLTPDDRVELDVRR